MRLLLSIVLLVLSSNLFAQNGQYGIGIKHYRGMMWAHRSSILHLEAPTRGLDIDLYRLPGKKPALWMKQFRKPVIGVSLNYLDLGRPNITGHAFGILPFIEFRAIQRPNFALHFRMASGIGYLDKKWDLKSNLKNNAIGSHFNGNMRLHWVGHYQVQENWSLDFGAGITHFSNGNFNLPNLGVNSIEWFLGLSWGKLCLPKDQPVSHKLADTTKRHHWEFAFGVASKVTNLIYPKRVTPIVVGARYFRQLWDISRFGGGLELTNDPSYVFRDNPDDVQQTQGLTNSSELAIFLSHDLTMGRLTFLAEGGTYLYKPSNLKGPLFQKLGFKYRIWEGLQARVLIKAHFARADYLEWGFAYTISR